MLGIPRHAELADITRAYKALALLYHPDKNIGRDDAEVAFKRIAEAYAALRDPARRIEYDRTGPASSYVSYEEAECLWRQCCRAEPPGPSFAAVPPPRKDVTWAPFERRKVLGVVLLATTCLSRSLWLDACFVTVLAVAVLGLLASGSSARGSRAVGGPLRLIVCVLVVVVVLRMMPRLAASRPPAGAARLLPQPSGADVWPRSGEELFLGEGHFTRSPDPQVRLGARPMHGWRQRLLAAADAAVRDGAQQVVLVFAREGCPWCDRQVHVFRRAIVRRMPPRGAAGELLAAQTRREGVQLDGGALLPAAPLRVFVLDADELPELAGEYRVQAFPTIVAWGLPGTVPARVQGFLDDGAFDQFLRAAASSRRSP